MIIVSGDTISSDIAANQTFRDTVEQQGSSG